nr:MerR family DNA-binding transcriptional regulator [Pseudonocardia sp. AL041005-10]
MSAAIDGSAMSPTPDDGDLLTVDQLAERTGMSVRTIRFYASKGLIPRPGCAAARVSTTPRTAPGWS